VAEAESSPRQENIARRVQLLRDLVNAPRTQRRLMTDPLAWFRLCSAMDALEDTEQAMAAHRGRTWEQGRVPVGLRYLAHYGFFQAAIVQQDAIRAICEVLDVGFDRSQFPRLAEIRQLRNDAVGHPTGRRDGSSHAIVQISMNADGFELGSWYADRSTRRNVDLDEVAADQRVGVSQALDQVIAHLSEQERRHKEQFVQRPLAPMLASSELGYALEKISAGARVGTARKLAGDSDIVMARGGLAVANSVLAELRDALRERGDFPDVYDLVDVLLTELQMAVDRLDATFTGRPGGVDAQSAGVYAYFLASKLHELREVLAEIDRDYASP
jgi:hypothetical protein